MNWADFGLVLPDAENLTPNMSTASGAGSGGNGSSNNDPNHNLFIEGPKCDPFTFLDDDELDHTSSMLGKPSREQTISLEDLVRLFLQFFFILMKIKCIFFVRNDLILLR